MPPRGRLICPVVGRQRVNPIEPAAEAGNHLLPGPLQADDPQPGLERQGFLDVREVEQGDVADQPLGTVPPEPLEPLADPGPSGGPMPRQERTPLVGDTGIGLAIEQVGQGVRAAASGPHAQDKSSAPEPPSHWGQS